MKEINGNMVATPASQHEVYCINDMEDGVLYPAGCFASFQMPRGRTLSDALAKDPMAPKPTLLVNSKCFSKAQIEEYVNSYSDDFGPAQIEISALARSCKDKMKDAISEAQEAAKDAEKKAQAVYDEKLRQFCDKFINDYTTSLKCADSEMCGIYFLKREGRIVYIGQSVNVYARVAQHRKDKDFDSVDFLPCDKSKLDDLEGFFIRLIKPELNGWNDDKIHGAPRSSIWGDVVSIPVR
jgi:hypothetical protein